MDSSVARKQRVQSSLLCVANGHLQSKVYTAVLKYRQQYLYFYQNVKVRNLNILAYGHEYPLHLFGVRCRRVAVSVSWIRNA